MPTKKRNNTCKFLLWVTFAAPICGQAKDFIGTDDIHDRRGETVSTRLRPDYDAQGVTAGVWTIRPSLNSEVGYDDNVLSSNSNKEGSVVLTNEAAVNAEGNWSGARVSIRSGIADYRYLDVSSQSYTNWGIGATGTYELQESWSVFGGARHEARHELQDDPGNPGSSEPVGYTLDNAHLGTRYRFNRLLLQPEVSIRSYRYDDAVFNTRELSQAYRDKDVYIGALTVGYALAPGRSLNLTGRVYRSNYINTQPIGFIPFDSTTYELMTGIDYDSDGIWNYRFLLGVRLRQYDDSRMKTATGVAADGYVSYRPSAMTTVTGVLFSVMEDGSTPGDSGYNRTTGRLAVDHEYLRNVILHASVGADYVNYLSQDRTWTSLSGTLGGAYLLNRNVRLFVGYSHTERFASRDADEFDRNQIFFRVRLAL